MSQAFRDAQRESDDERYDYDRNPTRRETMSFAEAQNRYDLATPADVVYGCLGCNYQTHYADKSTECPKCGCDEFAEVCVNEGEG